MLKSRKNVSFGIECDFSHSLKTVLTKSLITPGKDSHSNFTLFYIHHYMYVNYECQNRYQRKIYCY